MPGPSSCPICLARTRLTRLECVHSFCLACIKQWADKGTNACPVCRKPFEKVKANNGQVLEFSHKEQDFESDFYNEDDDGADLFSGEVCTICAEPEDEARPLILCSICEGVTIHAECLNLPPDADDWVCVDCLHEDSASSSPASSLAGSIIQAQDSNSQNQSDADESFHPVSSHFDDLDSESDALDTRHSQNVLQRDFEEFQELDGRVMTRHRLDKFLQERNFDFTSSYGASTDQFEDEEEEEKEEKLSVFSQQARPTVSRAVPRRICGGMLRFWASQKQDEEEQGSRCLEDEEEEEEESVWKGYQHARNSSANRELKFAAETAQRLSKGWLRR